MPHPHEHPDVDCETLADTLGPSTTPVGSNAPLPPVRGARWFAHADRLFTTADALLERWLPRTANPLAQLGPAANAMLSLATVSGVLLLIWYSASVQSAWHSLADLGPHSAGSIVRGVHRYASDLTMLLVLGHFVRAFLARKFASARWLAWMTGVGLLGLVWFIGWSGYWLVWDERAQLLALDTIRTIDVLPVFGEPMLRLFTSDQSVPSLLFFVVFFLHMALPLGIAIGLCLHVARLSRARLFPEWRLTAWLCGAVVIAAIVYPATSAPAAHMAVKPGSMSMDWWYLWPLAVTARLSGGGIWLTALLAATGLFTVPWWLTRRRAKPTFQATVNISRCFSCTLCTQDCPFGAITMVARTDGKPFPSQAQIDPDRCIGCGVCAGACDTQAIGLAWFDAQQVIRELEAQVISETARGAPPALAFVCAQSDGGWEMFDHVAWARRLPGYLVRPVPCVGWIEPKILERLLNKGATVALCVGCASSEALCREGNQWLPARLDGTREPEFRTNRAERRRVAHVNFDPSRPQLLTAAAAELRNLKFTTRTRTPSWVKPSLAGSVLTLAIFSALLGGGNAPFRNPARGEAEFVFTFRTYGEWISGAVAAPLDPSLDKRPVHMRTAGPAQRTRSPVTVRINVDGKTQERLFRPKGFKSDGASVGEMRVSLAPGVHRVTVEVVTARSTESKSQVWSTEFSAQERRLSVLSLDGGQEFKFVP
jgi:ferredoxin